MMSEPDEQSALEIVAGTITFPPTVGMVVRGNGFEVYCEQISPGVVAEHSHDELQIFVPFKHSSFVVDWQTEAGQQQNAIFRENDISLLCYDQPHAVKWEKSSSVVSFYLTRQFVEGAAADSAGGKIEFIPQYGVRDSFIQQLGLTMLREHQTGKTPTQLYTESLANVLAFHLIRNYSTNGFAPREFRTAGLPQPKLRRAVEFINANLSENIRLGEIAAELELSAFHFGRMFKQATGQTPYQYLLEQRIERGKRLLTDTRLPLVEIALQLGFSSQSHFTAVFRRLTGATPNDYRKKP